MAREWKRRHGTCGHRRRARRDRSGLIPARARTQRIDQPLWGRFACLQRLDALLGVFSFWAGLSPAGVRPSSAEPFRHRGDGSDQQHRCGHIDDRLDPLAPLDQNTCSKDVGGIRHPYRIPPTLADPCRSTDEMLRLQRRTCASTRPMRLASDIGCMVSMRIKAPKKRPNRTVTSTISCVMGLPTRIRHKVRSRYCDVGSVELHASK